MSKISLTPNASGTGTFTIESPNSNSNQTLTLPDSTGTLATTADIPSVNPFTLGTAVASTSGTAIDFTGIPSWAKRVTVMLNGVSTNGSSLIRFQLGTSGGVETSGYNAMCSYIGPSSAASVASSSGFDSQADGAAATTRQGQLIFSLLGSNTWVLTGAYIISTNAYVFFFTGSKTLSGTLDRVRITTVNGTDTFDAGTINISYEG